MYVIILCVATIARELGFVCLRLGQMRRPGIPVAPNAAGGIHVLSSDMLQHLELFARDPGDTILGKIQRDTPLINL